MDLKLQNSNLPFKNGDVCTGRSSYENDTKYYF